MIGAIELAPRATANQYITVSVTVKLRSEKILPMTFTLAKNICDHKNIVAGFSMLVFEIDLAVQRETGSLQPWEVTQLTLTPEG